MNKFFGFIKAVLPHLVFILSIMVATFVIINHINPYMQFVDNKGTKVIMIVHCLLAAAESVYLIVSFRGRDRGDGEKK